MSSIDNPRVLVYIAYLILQEYNSKFKHFLVISITETDTLKPFVVRIT